MWTSLRQKFWQWRIILVATPSVAVAVLGLRLLGLWQPLEWALLDQFFRLRPAEPQDPRIVIVEVTETDIQALGQWPMSDRQLTQLLQAIKQQNPVAIGLDLYRDLPQEPGSKELNQLFSTTPNLIGITKVIPNLIDNGTNRANGANPTAGVVKPPPILAEKGQVASNDLVIDPDGKVRRLLLSVKRQDETIPTLGTSLALLYLETQGITLAAAEGDSEALQLGKATFVPLRPNDGGYVRVELGGFQILSNFRNAREGYRRVTMMEVMNGKVPADLMQGRIVLIGLTAESAEDYVYTPYSSGLFKKTVPLTSGVAIHADVTSQILSAAADGRALFRFWSEPLEVLWIIAWSGVGAILTWVGHGASTARGRSPRFLARLPLIPISLSLAGGCLLGVGYLAFLQGWWIPVGPPLMALTGTAGVITIYLAHSVSKMRQMFGRYLTEEVVTNLLEAPGGFRLGGERRQVTMLMSDLRGFSAISERLPPEEAMTVVNTYLEVMTEVISQYNGIINEFIGDGIFVCFGAPVSRSDDPQRAVACAIAMQLALAEMNRRNQSMKLPTLEMGIGVHTGEVLTGNVGSQKRAKYTVVGSDVNLTSRIETYSVGGQVLISKQLMQFVGPIVTVAEQFQVQMKGMQEPVMLYEVIGIGDRFNLVLPREADQLVPLQYKVLVQYRVVKGKALDETVFRGVLLKLSTYRAEILLDQPVGELSNLQLNLLIGENKAKGLGDIYAKVIKNVTEDGTIVWIRFTAVPPEVAVVLHYLSQSSQADIV